MVALAGCIEHLPPPLSPPLLLPLRLTTMTTYGDNDDDDGMTVMCIEYAGSRHCILLHCIVLYRPVYDYTALCRIVSECLQNYS